MADFLLSVIVPVYNEQDNIEPLLERLLPAVDAFDYEIIFVNDGSTDRTEGIIRGVGKKYKNIKLISFFRNYGHQPALTCGYQHAKGDCVVSIDADSQDPPEIIPQMVRKWQEGAKIVYARRSSRQSEGFAKRTSAHLFYKWMNFLSDIPIPPEVGDFRLLDRQVVDFLNKLPEQSRFLRGLVAWGGYPAAYVEFERAKRHAGKTHYTFGKMVNLALDGLTSFSTKPLRLASYIGFFSATIGFLGIIYALIGRFFRPPFFPHDWVTGWTGLFVGIMFIGGVQLITIGIIGEYIAKIYKEVQKRPQYLIKETVNL